MLAASLRTIVAAAHANAHAGSADCDAGTRTGIPATIGAALDVSLARCVTVRIPDDHAAAAAGAIASSVIVADHAHRLHQRCFRSSVFAARIEVGGVRCTAGKQRAGAREQRDCESPHEFLRPNSALGLKPAAHFRSRKIETRRSRQRRSRVPFATYEEMLCGKLELEPSLAYRNTCRRQSAGSPLSSRLSARNRLRAASS